MSGTDIAYLPTRLLRDVRYCHSVWCYAILPTRMLKISGPSVSRGGPDGRTEGGREREREERGGVGREKLEQS
eukprot:1863329-Rhodomonas_salina.1